jgi:hypothetical protein
VTSDTGALFEPAGADIDEVDVTAFGHALTELTVADIRAISVDLASVCASPADDVATTRATLVIEQTLRRTHRLQRAAAAALVVATAVQQVAHDADVSMPDDDVTRVARAAAQLARAMVAGDGPGVDDALHWLIRGWHHLACWSELAA